jgi:hypothetical protein
MLVVTDHAGGRVQAIQATAERADPKSAVWSFGNGRRPIVAQAPGVRRVVAIDGKRTGCWIEPIETAASRADPENSGAVHVEVGDGVAAQAARVGRIVQIRGEAAGDRIETIDAATIGADPQRAVLWVVLQCRTHP